MLRWGIQEGYEHFVKGPCVRGTRRGVRDSLREMVGGMQREVQREASVGVSRRTLVRTVLHGC